MYSLGENFDTEATSLSTPFSELPVTLYKSQVSDIPVIFLPRHGKDHATPPHKINYRANLWALKEKKVSAIIAVNVVGGITENMAPGTLVIPDQLIDYTWGREHTFFDAFNNEDEEKRMYAWNLTAKTIMSVDEWITFFDQKNYDGDYFWFIP